MKLTANPAQAGFRRVLCDFAGPILIGVALIVAVPIALGFGRAASAAEPSLNIELNKAEDGDGACVASFVVRNAMNISVPFQVPAGRSGVPKKLGIDPALLNTTLDCRPIIACLHRHSFRFIRAAVCNRILVIRPFSKAIQKFLPSSEQRSFMNARPDISIYRDLRVAKRRHFA